jgi:hypothetical protein
MNLYTVRADHPIFGRPDLIKVSLDVAVELVKTLDQQGYENIVLEQEKRPAKKTVHRAKATYNLRSDHRGKVIG